MKQTVATKPKLVQISTAYGQAKDGSAAIPRSKYVEIRRDKPKSKNERDWPEYKTCKYTTEAIVTEGSEKGETKRVCANPECPVHHPKRHQQRAKADATFKAEQEKRRREEAIAQTTGIRVLKAIGEAVPVRLMKRDLMFLAQRLTAMLDERKIAVLIRQHGIGKPTEGEAAPKLLAAFLSKPRKASWDASWSRRSSCWRCTTRATPQEFSVRPRKSTRSTWTPFPKLSSRNLQQRRNPRAARKPKRK